MKKILTVMIISLAFSACNSGNLTADEMKYIVKGRNDLLGKLFISGNADSLGLIYAPEARLCLNGVDFITGRQAITDFWKKDMKSTVTHKMQTETITVRGVKNVIYETGRTYLNMTYADSTFNLIVKFCNVWRLQEDGSYLLDVDISNRDK